MHRLSLEYEESFETVAGCETSSTDFAQTGFLIWRFIYIFKTVFFAQIPMIRTVTGVDPEDSFSIHSIVLFNLRLSFWLPEQNCFILFYES